MQNSASVHKALQLTLTMFSPPVKIEQAQVHLAYSHISYHESNEKAYIC